MSTNENTLLLHSCCAPCTTAPLDALLSTGEQVDLFFYNPNIQPLEEYQRRLDALRAFLNAGPQQVVLHTGSYDEALWEKEVACWGGPYPLINGASDYAAFKEARKQRCTACYKLRFKALAAFAAAQGYRQLDTTLTISPYQFLPEIQETLEECASRHGLTVRRSDWSRYYPESTRCSRALGLYRQNYCGCRFSYQEAELERQARRSARKKDNQVS
jgi:predicted adenine nucleotide alpha hydrolase (AANH) superfamily ATPase